MSDKETIEELNNPDKDIEINYYKSIDEVLESLSLNSLRLLDLDGTLIMNRNSVKAAYKILAQGVNIICTNTGSHFLAEWFKGSKSRHDSLERIAIDQNNPIKDFITGADRQNWFSSKSSTIANLLPFSDSEKYNLMLYHICNYYQECTDKGTQPTIELVADMPLWRRTIQSAFNERFFLDRIRRDLESQGFDTSNIEFKLHLINLPFPGQEIINKLKKKIVNKNSPLEA